MGMEFRAYYLSQEWIKMGHQVTIISASFSHLRKNNPTVEQNFQEENIDGIKYVWIKTSSYNGNGIKRAKTMYQFVSSIISHAKFFISKYKPDVIITSSTYPLDTYAGQKLKKLSDHALLIHEVHDLWPLTPMMLGNMSEKNPFIWIMQRAENSAYMNSDKVVSVLPNAEKYMKQHGLEKGKFSYIPNGICVNDWNNICDPPKEYISEFSNLSSNNKFTIGYFGGHAISNSLDTVIDTARLLENSDVHFVLVGNGVEKRKLVESVKNNGITNVTFMDAVDKQQVPVLMDKCDALCINFHENPLYEYGVSPNKVFEYMMSGKPIIAGIKTQNFVVENCNCGIVVEPDNAFAMRDAAIELSKMTKHELSVMGKNGREAILKMYDYSVLAREFINIML